ncbi:MAG TPA: hypothetical protein VF114_07060, partial [Candidatus Limnocylindria bacterium]
MPANEKNSGLRDAGPAEISFGKENAEVQTIGIVLNVGNDQADEFERGFREQEAPIWSDLHERGLLVMATLSKLGITTVGVDGAT